MVGNFNTVPFAPPGMKPVAGGIFTMGSDRFYPEEAPPRRVKVDDFWIDDALVTNREFARFVAETGHVTMAEIAPDPSLYPGMPASLAAPGSLVFVKPAQPVEIGDPSAWWRFIPGADWRHPAGPGSSIADLDDHPVVHIAYSDAEAFADWAGKALPTEAEFEYAARGGLEGCDYAWGDVLAPSGAMLANYWQGLFPFANQSLDGWEGTSPVRSFAPNGFGLYDMVGNVWEWTQDWWSEASHPGSDRRKPSCCAINNPRGGKVFHSYDPEQPGTRIGRKVIKGGSHLCAENYCRRYRPAARQPETVETSTAHLGFRCVVRLPVT
ncbi:formylglycine-generating enzyme family protein [Novosphingobium sp. CF614]|uniref:formylglycine-generating enzyme family protein n=1 Tax=Novosphingobium sp. CF614 TaxID=1884364 RepID=UPI0035113E99